MITNFSTILNIFLHNFKMANLKKTFDQNFKI